MAKPTAPTWAPTLEDVGALVPHRTVNVNIPGSDVYLYTFTTDTRPIADKVTDMIAYVCDAIENLVPSVFTGIEHLATSAAKWRVAADVELSQSKRNADVNETYRALNERALYAASLFEMAYREHGNTAPAAEPVPYWSFPEPTSYGDRNDI